MNVKLAVTDCTQGARTPGRGLPPGLFKSHPSFTGGRKEKEGKKKEKRKKEKMHVSDSLHQLVLFTNFFFPAKKRKEKTDGVFGMRDYFIDVI